MNIHEEREFLHELLESTSVCKKCGKTPHQLDVLKGMTNDEKSTIEFPRGNPETCKHEWEKIDNMDIDLQEEGAWITRKNPSKYKNTLAFNKKDQDSIANPKNKSIVPFRGINKKWGIS